ncbi:hypothetical protein D0T08_00155 [Emticicia sp. C21]|nr:hypothetical protein D0T08_00155 [Emticicia sp. C21]
MPLFKYVRMKSITHLKKNVIHTLHEYEIIYVQMTDNTIGNSLTVIFDHKTHSSKLKKLIHSLKAKQLNCLCSFNPETWELAVTISK